MSEADAAPHVQPGDVLAGKYRVERILGQGGMGVVVAAHHLHLDEKVALKFLLPDAVRNPEAVTRFLREARAAAKIKSEHVARVSDVGQLENGSPYIVMEYLDGSDLADWLAAHPEMPIEQVVDFVLQACEALADAHALGIIHRDLKPANLFCTRRTDGQLSIKLLDFGISKLTAPDVAGDDLTKSSAVLGSPFYMSPEQMQGAKSIDARTDIWSLGVILFELLTGRRPFDHEAMTALAVQVVTEPAPALRAFRSDAPPQLEQIVAKCLAKNRARRFGTVGELAIALEPFAPKHARAAVERVVATLRNAALASAPSADATGPATRIVVDGDGPELGATTPRTNSSWGQTTNRPQARRRLVGIFAGLVAVGVVLAVGLFAPRRHDPSGAALGASAAAPSVPSTLDAPTATQPDSVATADSPPTASSDAVTTTPAPSALPTSHAARPSAVAGSKPRPTTSPAVPTPRPKVSCTPPFVVDGNGERKYKPECL